jgi:hypothetical protein
MRTMNHLLLIGAFMLNKPLDTHCLPWASQIHCEFEVQFHFMNKTAVIGRVQMDAYRSHNE